MQTRKSQKRNDRALVWYESNTANATTPVRRRDTAQVRSWCAPPEWLSIRPFARRAVLLPWLTGTVHGIGRLMTKHRRRQTSPAISGDDRLRRPHHPERGQFGHVAWPQLRAHALPPQQAGPLRPAGNPIPPTSQPVTLPHRRAHHVIHRSGGGQHNIANPQRPSAHGNRRTGDRPHQHLVARLRDHRSPRNRDSNPSPWSH